MRIAAMFTALGVTALVAAAPASAQVPAVAPAQGVQDLCGEPANLPPADSPTLYRCAELRFHPVNQPIVDGATYQTHLQAQWSLPSQNRWVPYNEQLIQAEFWNLWNSGFLDDLWIEVVDDPFANGVAGKKVVFHMEERSRVKFVDYTGSTRVGVSAIEQQLRDSGQAIRLDSFLDQATLRQVRGVINELYAEKGYQDVTIDTQITSLAGGPKLVQVVFDIDEGPRYQIKEIVFDGNDAYSDGKLRSQMIENKQDGFFSFLSGSGTYQESKFAEDAAKVQDYYWNHGYARVLVGTPQVETLSDKDDGSERYIRLRIPIDEGPRFKIGEVRFEGDTSLPPEALDALVKEFKVKPGDWYDRSKIDKGIEEVMKLYGSLGFWQATPLPRLEFSDAPTAAGAAPEAGTGGNGQTATAEGDEAVASPSLNVILEIDEGELFHVNRITIAGNTTTHDSVVRRELRIREGAPFNVAALQESIRRMNQLGYFQPFEGSDNEVQVEEVTGQTGLVDVTLNVIEQNRNQITFGAGVSQFDGFFGQLSYQTANFLGRGETLGVSLQQGAYADNYQVSFSEPYMFERPITMGIDVFKRTFQFPFQYSQDSVGGNFLLGFPVSDYSRLFVSYSYTQIRVFDISDAFLDPAVLAFNPFLADSLLVNTGGRRQVSKISPSWVFNTVDRPIFPSSGTRYTAAMDFAGLGGNTTFAQARLEAIWYKPITRRTSLGIRTAARYIKPYGQTDTLPIFEKYFIGGEYDVRGYDLRSISPIDPTTGFRSGGNKALIFNAEYALDIANPVRVLAFFDAGQVQDLGDPLRWKDPIQRVVQPAILTPLLFDPFASTGLLRPLNPLNDVTLERIGERSAFKTSAGVELRFFMPVVNVPFRLISAWNPQGNGVLTNNGRLTPRFTFRFAVGSTF